MAQKTFGGQCGECTSCGKCDRLLNRNSSPTIEKTTPKMEKDTTTKLYTFLIYSENVPGLLSQITAVFTRRQVNIESLNVCASSTPGAHKYTVTAICDERMARILTAQVEKRIEVLQAHFYTDDELFITVKHTFAVLNVKRNENGRIFTVVIFNFTVSYGTFSFR